ncbi:PREDICTED: uncharacterized protein LOC106741127 isoform X5 [Dinoponera quadriceps]|uniref:Uncharacterized protein LOC106741127 isoform X5 n=1 Tax=Dinoponera quadriceps TaxID=609295 RepID=A0A6P3WR06_DINQU|nr:PREDICTED: uncharacterized protein LOC106741127 isoform X5 [Dinoponera quadriceps]
MVAAVSDVGLQVLRFMNFAPRSPGTFSEGLSRLFGVAHTDLNRQEKLLLARDPEAAFRIRPRRALRFTVLLGGCLGGDGGGEGNTVMAPRSIARQAAPRCTPSRRATRSSGFRDRQRRATW